MITKTVLKTCLLALVLAAVGGCASQGGRLQASQASATTGATAQSSNPALDRFFAESERSSQIGR